MRFNPSLPNLLSYVRILIGLIIPLLLLWPGIEQSRYPGWNLWSAFCLFLVGAFTDFWDGWVARRRHLETPFGRILDPVADKIFILGTMASFAARGVYSYWYLVPLFLREIAVTFCRIAWLQQGKAVGAEKAGKVKLILQVVSVVFSFAAVITASRPLFVFNDIFLGIAVLMTVYSGVRFFQHNRELLADEKFVKTIPTLGVGCLRPCPGTYGSLLGLCLVTVSWRDPLLHLLLFLLLLALAYWSIPKTKLREGEDPVEFVVDEACGILLAFMGVPLSWETVLLGFALFRFLDVSKVPPLRWLEKKKGVHGIMWDDLGAGAYTWMILKWVVG